MFSFSLKILILKSNYHDKWNSVEVRLIYSYNLSSNYLEHQKIYNKIKTDSKNQKFLSFTSFVYIYLEILSLQHGKCSQMIRHWLRSFYKFTSYSILNVGKSSTKVTKYVNL